MRIEDHTKKNPQANRPQKSEPCGVRCAIPLPSKNLSAGVSIFVSFRSLEDNVSAHLSVAPIHPLVRSAENSHSSSRCASSEYRGEITAHPGPS